MEEQTDNGFTSFLGTGWSFPPKFSKQKRGVSLVSNELDIKESLQVLLSTELGERVMRPDYGCDLHYLLFEKLDATTRTYVGDLIRRSILLYESRIDIESIDFAPAIGDDNVIDIMIEFTVRTTNSRSNYVYPFYKIEGTNLST